MHATDGDLTLRTITAADLPALWEAAYGGDRSWLDWDGPYFPHDVPARDEFITVIGPRDYADNPWRAAIVVAGHPVGVVSAYYDDGDLRRWFECGIVIYDPTLWGRHIGQRALTLWIDHLFSVTDLPRVGFTTWSGNTRMLALGPRLGMTKEACVRQVRWWDGRWWDSVRYGVLRDEWGQRPQESVASSGSRVNSAVGDKGKRV